MVAKRWVTSAVLAPRRADAAAASQPAWPPPITMTSNESRVVSMTRTSIARSQKPEDVSRETTKRRFQCRPAIWRGDRGREPERLFHVKHPSDLQGLFHVKQPLTLRGLLTIKTVSRRRLRTPSRSFPDTEVPEDHVEDVLNIDSPEQSAKRIGRSPQILRGQFFAAAYHLDASLQRFRRLPQQPPLAFATDQAALARSKIILRKDNHRRDEFAEAVTMPRGNPEFSHTHRLPRCHGADLKIDLVAHQPDRCAARGCDLFALGVGEPQHQIGFGRAVARTAHAFLLDGIIS